MSKNFIGATLLVLAVGTCHAQSSVTLYGNLSAGIGYFNNVDPGHKYSFDDGNFIPNFFGFSGSEDLGGGLKTIFKLEAQISIGTGELIVPNQEFTRQSYVGLSSSRFGQVTLGHQPDFNYDLLGPLSNGYSVASFYAFHPGNLDELANTFEFNNSLKYYSGEYGGFSFGAMLGLGDQPGSFSTDRNYAFGGRYLNGPLTLVAAYADENNRFLEFASSIGLPTLLGTPVSSDMALVANNVKNLGAGASYQLGNVLLRGLFTQTRLTGNGYEQNANNVDVGANWRITPANALNGGVSLSRLASGRWMTLIVTDVYSLSRRTSLYATALYQQASGDGAVASMLSAGQASGRRQFGVTTGVQHFF